MTMHNAMMVAHPFFGYGTHKALPVPPAPVFPMFPYFSCSTLLGSIMKAKPSPTVLGMGGIPLVARNNDSGFLVPHLPSPPPDTLMPIIISLGGSKVIFGSSKTQIAVEGKGEQCGCCLMPFAPLGQNMACNDPCSYPSDYVLAVNTVEVGMTLGDVIAGFVSAALDVGISWLVGKSAGGLSEQLVGAVARQYVVRECLGEVAERMGERATAEVVSEIATETQTRLVFQAMEAWGSEGFKFLIGEGLNQETSLLTGGQVADTGALYDQSGERVAGLWGEGPAATADQRVHGLDGTERLPDTGAI